MVTDRQQHLIDIAAQIMGEPTGEIDFLHTALAQVALPYRDPGPDVRDWLRDNGRVTLIVSSGLQRTADGRLQVAGLPYGPKPRLLLTHLCSQAVRHQSATIPVAETLTGFMKDLGLPIAGRSIAMFREQLSRLAVARMQIRMTMGDGRERVVNTEPVRSFDLWLTGDNRQRSLWPSEITLAQDFYESLQKHALPLDPRAIQALQHSARALDCYTWLVARLPRVKKGRAFVSWAALHHQFGAEQDNIKSFKRAMTTALRQAIAVYPGARVRDVSGGIELLPSPPAIASK
jgi:hypothetical protein